MPVVVLLLLLFSIILYLYDYCVSSLLYTYANLPIPMADNLTTGIPATYLVLIFCYLY